MASSFAITAATNSVRLDAKRRGETAFTVFNSSGRPIRGRAQLVPENPAAAAWLTLAGIAERDFPIAGTQQYTVQIAVPPGAPAGSYPFRLDMVGVENPDEDYTEGPTVTFEVPKPQPQKKPFPWWILLVVAGVLVVGGSLLAILLWPRTVEVPDVAGLTISEAADVLVEASLSVGELDEAPSGEVAEGQVIRSEPAAGEEVRRGSEVTLIVSSGATETATPMPTEEPTEPTATPTLTQTPEPPTDKITFIFSGNIISFDDRSGVFDGSIEVGTWFTGQYTIDGTIADDNDLPTVGDYWHSEAEDGIQVEVGNYIFQTNPSNPRFLLEIINDHQERDGYLLRSYQNQILQRDTGDPLIVLGGLHISWQLDDDTATALPASSGDVMVLTAPNLSDWTQVFGLTIDADGGFFIRGVVDEITEQ